MFGAFEKIEVSIFGASHAEEIGVLIKGLPQGETIDTDELQRFVNRRKSVVKPWSTARQEDDKIIIESGLNNGRIDGVFRAVIKNKDAHSSDYASKTVVPRPSHADYAAIMKYSGQVDLRGGGRYSGRMTAPMCIAGGIAAQILDKRGIKSGAYVSEIGGEKATSYDFEKISYSDIINARSKGLFTLCEASDKRAVELIMLASEQNDSVGGAVECIIYGFPVGIGDALYEGLEGRLSVSLFAIPAVKAVEFGAGRGFSAMRGSVANDAFAIENGSIITLTNKNGGINGGISNGMPITLRVTFKPTPSIGAAQKSVDLEKMCETELKIRGRHDACIVPRAVAAVEAAVNLTLLDCILGKGGKI